MPVTASPLGKGCARRHLHRVPGKPSEGWEVLAYLRIPGICQHSQVGAQERHQELQEGRDEHH